MKKILFSCILFLVIILGCDIARETNDNQGKVLLVSFPLYKEALELARDWQFQTTAQELFYQTANSSPQIPDPAQQFVSKILTNSQTELASYLEGIGRPGIVSIRNPEEAVIVSDINLDLRYQTEAKEEVRQIDGNDYLFDIHNSFLNQGMSLFTSKVTGGSDVQSAYLPAYSFSATGEDKNWGVVVFNLSDDQAIEYTEAQWWKLSTEILENRNLMMMPNGFKAVVAEADGKEVSDLSYLAGMSNNHGIVVKALNAWDFNMNHGGVRAKVTFVMVMARGMSPLEPKEEVIFKPPYGVMLVYRQGEEDIPILSGYFPDLTTAVVAQGG